MKHPVLEDIQIFDDLSMKQKYRYMMKVFLKNNWKSSCHPLFLS